MSASLPPVNETVSSELEEFKKKLFNNAEHLITDFFPKQILLLNKLQKSEHWRMDNYSAIEPSFPVATSRRPIINGTSNTTVTPSTRSSTGANGSSDGATRKNARSSSNNDDEPPKKVMKYDSPDYPLICTNEHVNRVSGELKPLLRAILEKCNTVKVWISLLIPKMEDGNNFGVSIQTEVVKELCYAEEDSAKYLEEISEYYQTRAKLCSKIIKYPQVEDYKIAVKELDERQYSYLTKYVTSQILNLYALLFDMISKNYEKIKKPRNTNTSSMY